MIIYSIYITCFPKTFNVLQNLNKLSKRFYNVMRVWYKSLCKFLEMNIISNVTFLTEWNNSYFKRWDNDV